MNGTWHERTWMVHGMVHVHNLTDLASRAKPSTFFIVMVQIGTDEQMVHGDAWTSFVHLFLMAGYTAGPDLGTSSAVACRYMVLEIVDRSVQATHWYVVASQGEPADVHWRWHLFLFLLSSAKDIWMSGHENTVAWLASSPFFCLRALFARTRTVHWKYRHLFASAWQASRPDWSWPSEWSLSLSYLRQFNLQWRRWQMRMVRQANLQAQYMWMCEGRMTWLKDRRIFVHSPYIASTLLYILAGLIKLGILYNIDIWYNIFFYLYRRMQENGEYLYVDNGVWKEKWRWRMVGGGMVLYLHCNVCVMNGDENDNDVYLERKKARKWWYHLLKADDIIFRNSFLL